MFRKLLTTFALLSALALPGNALAKIRVAASINDLASIASSVGGDEVEVFSIARSTADTHHIEVLPSYMVKVSRANVYLKVGLGLDQWADGIIDGSRNAHIRVVDCSKDVPLLEKPTQQVNASMGDVHPYGNPHYWPDPRNGPSSPRRSPRRLLRSIRNMLLITGSVPISSGRKRRKRGSMRNR